MPLQKQLSLQQPSSPPRSPHQKGQHHHHPLHQQHPTVNKFTSDSLIYNNTGDIMKQNRNQYLRISCRRSSNSLFRNWGWSLNNDTTSLSRDTSVNKDTKHYKSPHKKKNLIRQKQVKQWWELTRSSRGHRCGCTNEKRSQTARLVALQEQQRQWYHPWKPGTF